MNTETATTAELSESLQHVRDTVNALTDLEDQLAAEIMRRRLVEIFEKYPDLYVVHWSEADECGGSPSLWTESSSPRVRGAGVWTDADTEVSDVVAWSEGACALLFGVAEDPKKITRTKLSREELLAKESMI